MVAFESLSRVLHFFHLLAAVVSVAACVHLLVRFFGRAGRTSAGRSGLATHARILGAAYLVTYALGCLIYPTFRVRVRAELLDRLHPWATGLFEIKEHASTLVLLPVLGLVVLSRRLDFGVEAQRRHRFFFGGLACVVLSVLVYDAWLGWYLGALRSI